jgi:hypothetical protein
MTSVCPLAFEADRAELLNPLDSNSTGRRRRHSDARRRRMDDVAFHAFAMGVHGRGVGHLPKLLHCRWVLGVPANEPIDCHRRTPVQSDQVSPPEPRGPLFFGHPNVAAEGSEPPSASEGERLLTVIAIAAPCPWSPTASAKRARSDRTSSSATRVGHGRLPPVGSLTYEQQRCQPMVIGVFV